MTGIEIVALVIFVTTLVASGLGFFYGLRLKEEGFLQTAWDYETNLWLTSFLFMTGMILLYLFG